MTQTSEAPENVTPRRRRGWWVALAVLVAMIVSIGAGGYAMMGRAIEAPQWVRAKIEERLVRDLPGFNVSFGNMSLVVRDQDLAQVILWDVNITNSDGAQVAQLSDIEAGFAPKALLQGQVSLVSLTVNGAVLTLKRDPQGRLGVALGDAFSEDTPSPDLRQISQMVDQAFLDPRLSELQEVRAESVTLRFEDQRVRRGWTADGGRLRLLRAGDHLRLEGDLALLGGGDGVATLAWQVSRKIGEVPVRFGFDLDGLRSGDIATQSKAMAWMADLEAPISGEMRGETNAEGQLEELKATLQIGAGVLQPNRETRPIRFDRGSMALTYRPQEGLVQFHDIRVRSPLGNARGEGTAQLEGLDTGWPKAISGQFSLSHLGLAKGTLFDDELLMQGASSEFKLDLDPFRLHIGRLQVTDPAYPVQASGVVYARQNGWELSIDAQASHTNVAQVMQFWPSSFKPKLRDWIAKNVLEGRVHDVVFALRAQADQKPEIYTDFRFEQGKVQVLRSLPPISEGVGRFTVYDDRLAVAVDSGVMDMGALGRAELQSSEFVIPDLLQKPVRGQIKLSSTGPVSAALGLIDNDAWRVLRKVNKGTDLASGRYALDGTIALPLAKGVKLPDVALNLKAKLRDVTSTKIVPGRKLAGNGLDLAVTNKQLRIDGPVTFDGVAAKGSYVQPFNGTGQVKASVTVTPQALSRLNINLPKGMVRGQGNGQLAISLPKGGTPSFNFSSNLAGIGLSIPQLGWSLSRGGKGALEVAGRLGKPIQVNKLALNAGGLRAQGNVDLAASGGLRALNLSRLRVGSWLDVKGRLVGRGKRTPGIEVTSGRVDLRNAPFGSGGGAAAGGAAATVPMTLALDELQITKSIALTRFRGNIEAGGAGMHGSFTANVGRKTAPISGKITPRNGGSAFELSARDAGDVLKGAGLLRTVSDGKMSLSLVPVRGQRGTYDGKLKILGTRLRNAPAIGAILDAISIVGLIDQANGPGIFFSDVEARFRLSPQQLILTKSSAVGPSMGVSLDGYYNLSSGKMDMQGVLSPVFFLNGIGQLIARQGEGLIGFNFTIKGRVDEPRVGVNPLSALTPGLFRDIFRRPPPKLNN